MVPFSASNGFGSEAIVYGASIMLVFDQKFLLPARLLDSRPKKVQRLSLRKASRLPRLWRLGRNATVRPQPNRPDLEIQFTDDAFTSRVYGESV
jgi:hypothetical protein